MANLVAITEPATGRIYRLHPSIAEHGEWFPSERNALRAALPGVVAFERSLARLAQQPKAKAVKRA